MSLDFDTFGGGVDLGNRGEGGEGERKVGCCSRSIRLFHSKLDRKP
jgi:hypothetical protein